jgi:hypothetical protein
MGLASPARALGEAAGPRTGSLLYHYFVRGPREPPPTGGKRPPPTGGGERPRDVESGLVVSTVRRPGAVSVSRAKSPGTYIFSPF